MVSPSQHHSRISSLHLQQLYLTHSSHQTLATYSLSARPSIIKIWQSDNPTVAFRSKPPTRLSKSPHRLLPSLAHGSFFQTSPAKEQRLIRSSPPTISKKFDWYCFESDHHSVVASSALRILTRGTFLYSVPGRSVHCTVPTSSEPTRPDPDTHQQKWLSPWSCPPRLVSVEDGLLDLILTTSNLCRFRNLHALSILQAENRRWCFELSG